MVMPDRYTRTYHTYIFLHVEIYEVRPPAYAHVVTRVVICM